MSEHHIYEEGRADVTGAPAGALDKTVAFDFDKVEDAADFASETPSKHDPAAALEAHAAAGHELIAIAGKRPIASGWRRIAPLSLDDAKARMARGGNVGVRLRDTDLVIDVDPRYFAANDDPLGRLCIDFGLPDAPVVMTGGGGQHLYFRKPADVEIAGKLAGHDGIEFKSNGGQVVAAGSIHPDTARVYRLDDDALALSLAEAPKAPTALLDALAKRSTVASTQVGAIDEMELAEWLSHIDVNEYKDQQKWQEFMMSCHYATGGAGIDVFIDWSIADPEYANDSEIISRRWNSLKVKAGAITARTLIAALPKEMRREATELLNRIAAVDDFPDDMAGQTEKPKSSGVGDDWVWVAEPYQFVRRSDTRKFGTEQWKSLFAGLKPDGDVLNAIWKGNLLMRKFETLVYLPEAEEFPDSEAGGRYNLWRRSGVEASEGDVSLFLDHMAHLFPEENDRDHVLDYLALLVQKPAEKIHFALMIRGVQGTGKSWIGNLMERIVGSRNTVRPSNDEVVSHWTAWMEGAQLAIIEELMTLGRKEVANRLKPAITDPTLRIEEKNCRIYSIPNCLNFLCFTNHEDALPIEHGDRRWLVAFSPAQKRDAGYYETLFGFLDSGGASFVKHWLSQRKIALNPRGVAPATTGKETMRRLGMGDAETYLLDLFEAASPPFDFDLVRLNDLVETVPTSLRGRSNLHARVSKLLRDEIGAIDHVRYTKGDKDRPAVQLWSVRNHDVWRNIGAAGRIDAFMQHRYAATID